jgi:hypothetical protein
MILIQPNLHKAYPILIAFHENIKYIIVHPL